MHEKLRTKSTSGGFAPHQIKTKLPINYTGALTVTLNNNASQFLVRFRQMFLFSSKASI